MANTNKKKFTCTEDRLLSACHIMRPHTHADDNEEIILCDCGEGHCFDLYGYGDCIPNEHKTGNWVGHCINCHEDDECGCFDPE